MRYPPLLVRSRNGAELNTERGRIIDFTSWDLFGIASHPHVRAAAHAAMERFGVSSISAIERSGYTDIHQRTEQLLAKKLGVERAILFPNRTQAIISLVSAGLNFRGGPILIDSSVSSPVSDACHLAELESLRVDVRGMLAGTATLPPGPAVLILEAVSKNGFHIHNISKLLEKITIPLIADESFSFGVTGLVGMGNFPPPLLNNLPLARVLSFEATLGLSCCAVLGSKNLIEELCGASKQRTGEICVAPSEVAAVSAGLEILEQMAQRRDELGIKSSQFLSSVQSQGVKVESDLPLPIITLKFSSAKIAQEFSLGMLSRGFLLDFLGSLTPLSQASYVRIVLGAAHSQAHVEELARSTIEIFKRFQTSH